MAEWNTLWTLMGALTVATVMAAVIAIATAPPPAARAVMWRRQQVATTGRFWQAFQAEVIAELARAPQIAPPRAGNPDPSSEVPPLYLYHGTHRRNLASVFARGIEGRSGGRAFAAADYRTAEGYGRRWGGEYVIFRVLAQQAYQNGVVFQKRGGYYITRQVHPAYVDFHWTLADYAQRNHVAA